MEHALTTPLLALPVHSVTSQPLGLQAEAHFLPTVQEQEGRVCEDAYEPAPITSAGQCTVPEPWWQDRVTGTAPLDNTPGPQSRPASPGSQGPPWQVTAEQNMGCGKARF